MEAKSVCWPLHRALGTKPGSTAASPAEITAAEPERCKPNCLHQRQSSTQQDNRAYVTGAEEDLTECLEGNVVVVKQKHSNVF